MPHDAFEMWVIVTISNLYQNDKFYSPNTNKSLLRLRFKA